MDINSAFNSGLQALHRADAGLRRNAETIARNSARIEGAEDINTALVQAKQFQMQGEIAVEVVSAANETEKTLGSLLDTTA